MITLQAGEGSEGVRHPSPWRLSLFSFSGMLAFGCCDKTSGKINLKEEGFVLAHGFGGLSSGLLAQLLFRPATRKNIVEEEGCQLLVARKERGREGGRARACARMHK